MVSHTRTMPKRDVRSGKHERLPSFVPRSGLRFEYRGLIRATVNSGEKKGFEKTAHHHRGDKDSDWLRGNAEPLHDESFRMLSRRAK